MLNGLAKLSFLTTTYSGTLRELTAMSWGDAGPSAGWQNAEPPPLGLLLAALGTWPCVLLGRTHFK